MNRSNISDDDYIAALNRDLMRERARAEEAEAENEQLRKTLITAMVKLHVHVIHAGTTFEEEAAKLAGVELSPSYYEWGNDWLEAKSKS